MKKIICSILLVTIFTLCFYGCNKNKYPPVKSSAREAETVITMTYDDYKFDVRYELYRALFLSNKNHVDNENSSVWDSAEKDKYIASINEIIISYAAEIYAPFVLATEIGIDPYSKEVDNQIDELIRIAVEGGDGSIGFGGDYDAYLTSLKENNHNYETQRLMLRYSVLLEMINEYYKGYEDEALGWIDGDFTVSEDDVRDFYFSDKTARILQAYIQDGAYADTKSRAEELVSGIRNCSDDYDVALYIINHTAQIPTELIKNKQVSGIVITKNSLDDNFDELTSCTFDLPYGQASDPIRVDGIGSGYYIIYKLDKSEEHFSLCYKEICDEYIDNLINERLSQIGEFLVSNTKTTRNYNNIIHKDISMQ